MFRDWSQWMPLQFQSPVKRPSLQPLAAVTIWSHYGDVCLTARRTIAFTLITKLKLSRLQVSPVNADFAFDKFSLVGSSKSHISALLLNLTR